MALFGSINAGGAQRNFLGQPVVQQRFQPIIGISTGLIAASIDANQAQLALNALSPEERARINFRGDDATVVPPWLRQEEEGRTPSLDAQMREIRSLNSFIDEDFEEFREASGDPDSQATFVIFRALERLKAIAEFAGRDGTPEASLERLNDQFQQGLTEIREYIGETPLNQLELFLGDKESRTETAARLGRNSSSFDGALITADKDAALQGVTGSEVFTVTLSKTDLDGNVTRTDDFTVDLSTISGTVSLEAVSSLINSQISALQATDGNGDPIVDDNGDPVSEYRTRFNVERDNDAREFRLAIDSSILERVSLAATDFTPSLYVASGVTPVGTDQTTTARLQEVSNLEGTLEVSTRQSFAGIDLAETELAENTADPEDESTLTAEQAALRDQFRSDAREDVLTDAQLDAFNAEQTANAQAGRAITDIDDEFRVNANTAATEVATDSQGNVFVVGTTEGTFGNQINTAGENDVFLTKFDSSGNVIFSRLLGSSGSAEGYAVTVDDRDNVIVAGQTDNNIVSNDLISGQDAFVVKFDNTGGELLRYQLDTAGATAGLSVATTASTVDGNGNPVDGDIIIGGFTRGGISATSGYSGSSDGLLLRVDGTTGALEASNVFGTTSAESVRGIAVAADGNILVAAEENGNAVLRKFDAADLSTELYSQTLGTLGGGAINGLAVEGNQVVIAGTTVGQSLDSSGAATVVGGSSGGRDGFVASFTDNGASITADFTTLLGTSGTDRIRDVSVANGNIFVAGTTTGTFAGETDRGAVDGFVSRINGTTGTLEDTEQFGQFLSNAEVGGVAFSSRGSSVLNALGLASGEINSPESRTVEAQTTAREGDYFTLRIDNGRLGRNVRIELEAGDTYEDIAREIRTRAFNAAKVTVSNTDQGPSLKIEALNSRTAPELELIPGADGRDLLSRIGLDAGRLLPSDVVLGLNEDESEESLGGAFGLRLEGALNVKSRSAARFVSGEIDSAISQIQRAYRSLTFNPFRDDFDQSGPGNRDGQPSQRTLNKIANFTTALQRIQATQSSQPGFSLFT